MSPGSNISCWYLNMHAVSGMSIVHRQISWKTSVTADLSARWHKGRAHGLDTTWKWLSSWMSRRAVWYISTDFSEVPAASIIREISPLDAIASPWNHFKSRFTFKIRKVAKKCYVGRPVSWNIAKIVLATNYKWSGWFSRRCFMPYGLTPCWRDSGVICGICANRYGKYSIKGVECVAHTVNHTPCCAGL
jgi:hypothetical protein